MAFAQSQTPATMPTMSAMKTTKGVSEFTISNVHVSIINGLRRTILGHLPALGIVAFPESETTIRIAQNTSPFHNEILKQRLSCIAFNLNPNDELAGRIEFRLKVENTDSRTRLVTVADATLWDSVTEKQRTPEATRQILPPDSLTGDHALLLILPPPVGSSPGGVIDLKATLKRVTPNDSGAYALASTCAFGHVINKEAREDARVAAGVPDEPYAKSVWEESVVGRFNIPDTYLFKIRSVGWMNDKALLQQGLVHMQRELLAISERATNSALNVKKARDVVADNCFDVEIPGDTYALGHALRHQLYETDCTERGALLLVGFDKKHAHDTNGELRLVFKNDSSAANASNLVAKAAKEVAMVYEALIKQLPQ